jgi:RIP metalloprotease RseP
MVVVSAALFSLAAILSFVIVVGYKAIIHTQLQNAADAAALAGAGGIMFAMYYNTINFHDGYLLGLKAFTAAVFGGIGSIPGAMLGGISLGIFESLGAGYISSEWKDVFAFVILVIAFSVGFASISQDLEAIPGATVKNAQVLVSKTQAGSAAEAAGLQPGDLITSFTNSATGTTTEVKTVANLVETTKQFQDNGVRSVIIHLDREGSALDVAAELAADGPPLGVYVQSLATVRVPFWRAPEVAIKEIGAIIGLTWDALSGFGQRLFLKAELDPNVSGPVGIYQATGAATQAGAIPTIFLIVALSINLALLNILPIPALDGGKLLFLLVEAGARKRLLGRRLESAVTFAGFVLLIGLILILSVRDVIRLF